MRVLPLIVLSVVLVLAGCAKKEEPPATTTTPTGNVTGTTPGTNVTNPTSPTTTAVTPKDLKTGNVQFDPTACPPTMGCSGFPVKFTVDPGYTKLTLNVTFTCVGGAPACITNDATIAVGSNSCTLPPGPVQGGGSCKKEFTAADGQITATGNGAIAASYKLTES